MTSDATVGKMDLEKRDTGISLRAAALVAGIGLLLMAVPAAIANFFIVEGLVVPGDAAATADNILANEQLFRLGILSFLVVIVLDIVVAWAFYVLFEPVNRSLSLLTAWFRLAYGVMFAAALFFLIAALNLLTGSGMEGLGTGQLQAQALLSVNAFSDGWSASYVFFGLHLILLGYLAFKSGYVPKVLGILVVVAGLGYLFDAVAGVLMPDIGFSVGMITFFGELLLALWLVYKGLTVKRWEVLAASDVA